MTTTALTHSMTDLDAALEGAEVQGPSLTGAVGRKCWRHRWTEVIIWSADYPQSLRHAIGVEARCARCGVVRDETRAKRGKSSRRLGSDQERRAERRYGWEKIGERGQMTDLRGKLAKVQQKASRRQPPALFRAVFGGLEQTRDGRIPLLLLSYVKQGVGADDYIVIRGRDWLDHFGRDDPEATDG